MRRVLVTGSAGFIGFHVARALLEQGCEVYGLDNLASANEPSLSRARLNRLVGTPGFDFVEGDITDRDSLVKVFEEARPDTVVHLAARTGVRDSVENPHLYLDSNVTGFLNILEGCRRGGVGHLVFASSSSVYGAHPHLPSAVDGRTDSPLNLYAVTKKTNELMAHSYSHLHGVRSTGLRMFTVYGPWGRPDMAIFSFTRAIIEGRPIDVYNYGLMRRDFTYIDDAVDGILLAAGRPAAEPPACKIYNIGNHEPEELGYVIELLEERIGKKAIKNLLPMPAADMQTTYADISALHHDTGFCPNISLEEGIDRFYDWYKSFYG